MKHKKTIIVGSIILCLLILLIILLVKVKTSKKDFVALELQEGDKVLVLGDSFIEKYSENNWATKLVELLGVNNNNSVVLGEEGAGFYNKSGKGNNFLEILKNNEGAISEKEKFKAIIIGGGTNDMNATSKNMILEPMKELINYCNNEYKNANVYITEFGWFMKYDKVINRERINTIVIPSYRDCSKYEAIYLDTEMCYRNQELYDGNDPKNDTMVHPNDKGQEEIAKAIYYKITNKEQEIKEMKSSDMIKVGNDVLESTLYMNDTIENKKHNLNLSGKITISKEYDNNSITINLGNTSNPYIRRSNTNNGDIGNIECTLYCDNNEEIKVTGKLQLNNNSEFEIKLPEGIEAESKFNIIGIEIEDTIEFKQYDY